MYIAIFVKLSCKYFMERSLPWVEQILVTIEVISAISELTANLVGKYNAIGKERFAD